MGGRDDHGGASDRDEKAEQEPGAYREPDDPADEGADDPDEGGAADSHLRMTGSDETPECSYDETPEYPAHQQPEDHVGKATPRRSGTLIAPVTFGAVRRDDGCDERGRSPLAAPRARCAARRGRGPDTGRHDGRKGTPGRNADEKKGGAVAANGALPVTSPSIANRWAHDGPDELVLRPSAPLLPLTPVTLRIPGRRRGVRAVDGAWLASTVVDRWQVANRSVLRLQEVLATLGYLPLTWTPAANQHLDASTDLDAIYQPPQGSFAWRYPDTPLTLQQAWAPGEANQMTTGAMIAFEVHDGFPATRRSVPCCGQSCFRPRRLGRRTRRATFTPSCLRRCPSR